MYLHSSPALLDRHLFDTIDGYAAARRLGCMGLPIENADLAELACRAARRALRAAAFRPAEAYVALADSLVDFEDPKTWQVLRPLAFDFASVFW